MIAVMAAVAVVATMPTTETQQQSQPDAMVWTGPGGETGWGWPGITVPGGAGGYQFWTCGGHVGGG